jgi:competence ComEA-like helix-hairpin-helix protein
MLASVLVLCLATSAPAGKAPALPPGKGKAIVARTCKNCHALKVVTSKRATKEQWSALVDQMVSRGADLSDDEIDVVVDYLAKNFALKGAPAVPAGKNFLSQQDIESINVNQATANELAAVLHLPLEQSRALVAYRDAHGNFKSWHELASVPGVHARDIEAQKDRLRF